MERMKEKADIVAKEVGKKKPEEDGWDHLRKMLGVAYRVLKDVVNENGLKMEDICGFDHLKKGLMAGGNEEKLEEVLRALELDDYFELILSDRKGEKMYVIHLHSQGLAYKRSDSQRKRGLYFKLGVAAAGAVLSFLIGMILKAIFG